MPPANFPLHSATLLNKKTGLSFLYTAGGLMNCMLLFGDMVDKYQAEITAGVPDKFEAVTVDVNVENKVVIFGGIVNGLDSVVLVYDVSADPMAPKLLNSHKISSVGWQSTDELPLRVTSLATQGNYVVYILEGWMGDSKIGYLDIGGDTGAEGKKMDTELMEALKEYAASPTKTATTSRNPTDPTRRPTKEPTSDKPTPIPSEDATTTSPTTKTTINETPTDEPNKVPTTAEPSKSPTHQQYEPTVSPSALDTNAPTAEGSKSLSNRSLRGKDETPTPAKLYNMFIDTERAAR